MKINEVVDQLKSLGCTWVHFSNYWDGAGYVVNESGRAIALYRFSVRYEKVGTQWGRYGEEPVFKSDYSNIDLYQYREAFWEEYYPHEYAYPGLGYCLPIDKVVDDWRQRTKKFYQDKGVEQP
jgi:hypothetical protein